MGEPAGVNEVTIVVPCFNEAARLNRNAFLEFSRDNPLYRFLFLDDGSRDDTYRVLQDLCADQGFNGEVFRLETNSGKATAVHHGMNASFSAGSPLVGYLDADLATPLAEVPFMIEVLRARFEIDMVFGARVKLLGRRIERRLIRHYLGRCFATVASFTLGLEIYDTQCGAKFFRNNERIRRIFEAPFTSRWIFDVEILARYIGQCRASSTSPERGIYEHPLNKWQDVAGSKLRPSDFLRALVDLMQIRRKYL